MPAYLIDVSLTNTAGIVVGEDDDGSGWYVVRLDMPGVGWDDGDPVAEVLVAGDILAQLAGMRR